MSEDTHHGHCLCGATQFEVKGTPAWVGHCHCSSCRRATASSIATFVCFKKDGFKVTAGEMTQFESSAGVYRSFCPKCGTPMTYEADALGEEIHIQLGSLDKPEDFPAIVEVYCAEKLPWLQIDVAGPSFESLPPQG
jgi:hypothetical protein